MEDCLRIMTRSSLEDWFQFVQRAGLGQVIHGVLPKDTTTKYGSKGCSVLEERLATIKQGQPVFKIVVIQSKEKVVLNAKEIQTQQLLIDEWLIENKEAIAKSKKDHLKGMFYSKLTVRCASCIVNESGSYY